MDVMPLDKISSKWRGRAQVSRDAYEDGVRNPRRSWAREAYHAFDRYKEGIRASVSADLFRKGVHRAGDAKWQERAVNLGVPRWPQGIDASGPAYTEGFAPYHAALSQLRLPPRYARGDPRNLERVKAIAEALHKLKTGAASPAAA